MITNAQKLLGRIYGRDVGVRNTISFSLISPSSLYPPTPTFSLLHTYTGSKTLT